MKSPMSRLNLQTDKLDDGEKTEKSVNAPGSEKMPT